MSEASKLISSSLASASVLNVFQYATAVSQAAPLECIDVLLNNQKFDLEQSFLHELPFRYLLQTVMRPSHMFSKTFPRIPQNVAPEVDNFDNVKSNVFWCNSN
jgi:hypothetical protein